MSKKNIHTVFNSERGMWETKREGQSDPIASSHTKETAEEKSVRQAKKDKVEHIIHRKDGVISERESYGNESKTKDAEH
jgi:Uncharacterized protein conserved in bacteria (DUF2188)